MAVIFFFGETISISTIFQMPWRNLQTIVLLRVFARTPSMVRQIVRICDVDSFP